MTRKTQKRSRAEASPYSEPKSRVIKEKFVTEREKKLTPIQALTSKQKQYIRALNDPAVQVVVALGFHGTGKSFVASVTAADKFHKGEIDKIIVSRPYVQTGRTSGFKPGTTLEKLYPYVRNVLDTIKARIGAGAFDIALKDGTSGAIEVQEVESIRGRSFDQPSFVIIDEAQQTRKDEMLSIVTRISDNSKLILCGDVNQKDIQGESGLEWFLDFVKRHKLSGVEVIDFSDVDDIVRGGFVKEVAIGLMKDNKKGTK